MSNLHAEALELLNKFAEQSVAINDLFDGSKGSYIYLDLETPDTYLELELESVSINGKTILNMLTEGLEITAEDVIEGARNTRWSHIPEVITKQDMEDLQNELDRSYWLAYKAATCRAKNLKDRFEELNKQAGTVLVNPKVVDGMLQAAVEFYESSRCW